MEFPFLGQHCSQALCHQLDFLPMKCDACDNIYCKEHILYRQHECEASYKKDVQVPVCPLCNKPVPGNRGEPPDLAVGEHIDRDCQSDPALQKRKIYINRCSVKGCKQKELVKVLCSSCRRNYCLKHRHTQDHNCQAPIGNDRPVSLAGAVAMSRVKESNSYKTTVHNPQSRPFQTPVRPRASSIQGNLSEDEALARAIQISLQSGETNKPEMSQEEEDRLLAQALAASETNSNHHKQQGSQSKDKCIIT